MALFTMNMYRHWVRLIVREPGDNPCIILSKEGIAQGAPEAMFHYAVGMLPLAEKLREGHGNITSPFYADNLNLAGRARKVAQAFATARRHGSSLGYFAGALKLWCVCTAADETEVKAIMLEHEIAIQHIIHGAGVLPRTVLSGRSEERRVAKRGLYRARLKPCFTTP